MDTDVVVIGAGQGGLSAGYFLRRSDIDFVMLDANPGPGGAWRHRWPSLRMDRVHGIHTLPGRPLGDVAGSARAAEAMAGYFDAYEREFALPVRRPVRVLGVHDLGSRLAVRTDVGDWSASAVISATGTWDRPFWPHYPGQGTFLGRQLHTADYPGPAEFAGLRVVVVGGGSSAIGHLLELAPVAASTTWVTRRPPVFRAEPFTQEYGRAVVARVDDAVRAGRPPSSVVGNTGLVLSPEVARAKADGLLDRLPMFDRITQSGVEWASGERGEADVILWATGFRASLEHLAPLRLRGPGGGIVMDGTRVVAEPRLHLIGYGPSASTVGANRAGRAAVREIRELLATRSSSAV